MGIVQAMGGSQVLSAAVVGDHQPVAVDAHPWFGRPRRQRQRWSLASGQVALCVPVVGHERMQARLLDDGESVAIGESVGELDGGKTRKTVAVLLPDQRQRGGERGCGADAEQRGGGARRMQQPQRAGRHRRTDRDQQRHRVARVGAVVKEHQLDDEQGGKGKHGDTRGGNQADVLVGFSSNNQNSILAWMNNCQVSNRAGMKPAMDMTRSNGRPVSRGLTARLACTGRPTWASPNGPPPRNGRPIS